MLYSCDSENLIVFSNQIFPVPHIIVNFRSHLEHDLKAIWPSDF